MKSPNLTNRQTTTNNTTKAALPELAIQKLHKEKIQPTPNPTGQKRRLAKLEDFNHMPKQLNIIYNDAA
ncbi:hypothetical protein [Corynebacterium hiratae]|uniref:Uncharacterized protein n=1 Tax=Corynebacterium hiratae TaxID=3139423 RepID=A0A553FUT6_9CORY|nr:hypothetical protein [Corynebacterium aurimucosum]TRX61026.1 hypothetical protein FNY97_08070 [Corynebacterium aurimucosum]